MTPSFFQRIGTAIKHIASGTPVSVSVTKTNVETISNIKPDSWMAPLQPLPAYRPTVEARQWDYKVGRNLFYLPRGDQRISFALLRDIAYGCDLIRFAIETRKDQMCSLHYSFKPLQDIKSSIDPDNDSRIELLQDFFKKPDRINSWRDWLRLSLEEIMVTDALTIYKRQNRGENLYALELLDGSTIFPLVDEGGRRPVAPEPAYQQILKGVPKADYDVNELLYIPYSRRINTPYGYPLVEQAITAAQTEIERMKSQLLQFTSGSVPDAYATMPDGMTPDMVLAFERHINDMLAGNLAGRRQMPFFLHGTEIKQLKPPALKDEFDEWLVRKICFAFSLPVTAFVKQNNRATAESEKDRALEEGLAPLQLFIKGIIDDIIQNDFGFKDLEFAWNDTQDIDPSVQATVDASDVAHAIRSVNEIRADRGLDPVEGGDEPLALTATGWIPLPGSKLDIQMKAEQAAQPKQHDNDNANKLIKKKYYAASSHLH